MQTFGQYIVESLKQYGVECVFGIPGVHTIELYRGLAGSGIRHITPRHEQGAGFMADGYARVSGKPGVCFIITGPGLTNVATAMGQAYGDSIPMLVLSTVNSAGALGSGEGHLHELPDQSQLMRQVSAFSHTVHHPEEFDTVLARAFALFGSARPRPVHIEIPVEMLSRPVKRTQTHERRAVVTPPAADPDAVAGVAALLEVARRPLIIAGGGAVGAADAIGALAERLQAPVLMTINGRGILPPAHPLGLSISAASAPALDLMEEADLLLAVGTELGPTDFDESLKARRHFGGKLIRVDIDPEQLMRSLLPAHGLAGDSCASVEALLGAIAPAERQGWGGSRRAEGKAGAVACAVSRPILADRNAGHTAGQPARCRSCWRFQPAGLCGLHRLCRSWPAKLLQFRHRLRNSWIWPARGAWRARRRAGPAGGCDHGGWRAAIYPCGDGQRHGTRRAPHHDTVEQPGLWRDREGHDPLAGRAAGCADLHPGFQGDCRGLRLGTYDRRGLRGAVRDRQGSGRRRPPPCHRNR